MGTIKVIAYYLPQFHPIKENNEWWGEGFTEWTNVTKARPCFPGHKQPHYPADLGYYDLRLNEVQIKQAEMAKEAGIAAFCYWHYWMGGVQLLEKPLEQVLQTGKPDFPFCLGWANHTWWKKIWNRDVSRFNNEILIEQTYPGKQDVIDHFNALLPCFKDSRYYKIEGKLVFMLYNINGIPNVGEFISTWQQLAKDNKLPGFYFISRVTDKNQYNIASRSEIDAMVNENFNDLFTPRFISHKTRNIISSLLHFPLSIMSYKHFISKLDYSLPSSENNIYPTVYPNWDNSPRIGYCSNILTGASPELFKKHVKKVCDFVSKKPVKDRIIFLKSWNEWAEGNYMEPDQEYGKGRIRALREVLDCYE